MNDNAFGAPGDRGVYASDITQTVFRDDGIDDHFNQTVVTPRIKGLSHYRRNPAGIHVRPVASGELGTLHAFVMAALGPGIASIDTVRRVQAKQGFSMWKVLDREFAWSGAYAFLYLNAEGLSAVHDGSFVSIDPDMEHLAQSPHDVVGIFAWCLVLRGRSKFALHKAATWLDLCGWHDVPLFTNPVTPEGERLARSLGFVPLNEPESSVFIAL
ncbi:MAG: hypothetical protein AAF813_02685 [Pseudomonadota bacterium]